MNPGALPDDYLFQNGNVNAAAIERWRNSQKLTWHHHQDMQNMQLVKDDVHSFAKHQGGQSYAASVTQELMERGIMTGKRQGLDANLIHQARELGIIPAEFVW